MPHVPAGSIVACIALAIFIGGPARAADPDDFRGAASAARRDQCTTATIPYPDLRNAADDGQGDITRWCKEAPRSCESLGTRKQAEALEASKKVLGSLQRERDLLERQKSSAPAGPTRADLERELAAKVKAIEAREKQIDFTEKSLRTDRGDAAIRVANGHRCVKARQDVQKPFREASARALADGRKDARIEVHAAPLRDRWKACEAGHVKDIDAARKAVELCEDARDGKR